VTSGEVSTTIVFGAALFLQAESVKNKNPIKLKKRFFLIGQR
jgi:hypothetical protein